ncbi:MAG: hypothetical protein ACI8P3_002231 [Saprospiraceae bacterium]|jgi:hypothetical protein
MKNIKYLLYSLIFLTVSLFGYMKFTNQNINEIGLKFFSWIKKMKGESVDLTKLSNKETTMVDHQIWTALLSKQVSTAGNVDYKGIIADKASLDTYLAALSDNPPGVNWGENDKIAYWINAYNAFTVKLIVDNYPLKSIKDIGNGLPMINSPWDIKFFKIGDTDFDLNTIEHEILRKQFQEPRIHFAINCASFSCPKLRNEAFEAKTLDKQLDEQARSFINNPDKNKIDNKETQLSKIFSWFENDFTKKGSIKSFIKKYHEEFNENNKLQYIDYVWTLNE